MRYYDTAWHGGQARQGMLGGTRYRGEMTFDFAAQLDVSSIDISEITLTLTAGSLGGDYTKYLYLKTGGWDGAAAEDFAFTSFFDTTKSKTMNADSYPTAFSRLKAFIEGGGAVLGVYAASSRGKSSSKSYDYDYCNITAATLALTYSWKKSSGTIASAKTGSAATLKIKAGGSGYRHRVTWKLGGNSHSQTLAAGVTEASYVIPHAWLPNAASGTATVTLETLDGTTSLGSRSYGFSVSVPASVKPSLPAAAVSVAPVFLSGVSAAAQGWGRFIQGKSKARVTIDRSAASPGDGATISGCAISCPSLGSASGDSYTSPALTKAGSLTFTATVTDSRGRTASRDVTIAVQAYAAPKFTAKPTAFRCNSAGARQDTAGTWASLTAGFACSSVDGQNSLTVHSVALEGVSTPLTSGAAAIIGAGSLALDGDYTAVITLTDAVGGTTTYRLAIPSAAYLLHFRKGGGSIGLGRAAGEGSDATVHVGWDMALDAGRGVRVTGNGAAQAAFLAQSADGAKQCSVAVGSGGVNRGLFDATNGHWMLYTGADDVSRIERPLAVADEAYFRHVNVGNASGIVPAVRFRGADDAPLAAVQFSPSSRRLSMLEYPGDYDADGHAFFERYHLPAADSGLSETKDYYVLTSKTAVSVARGGTGAGSAAGARANLGIQCGGIAPDTITIPAGGYVERSVTFPAPFAAAPNVVVGFLSDSTAGAFGECCCGAYDITTSGFTLRAYNAGGANRLPGYQWIAVGNP